MAGFYSLLAVLFNLIGLGLTVAGLYYYQQAQINKQDPQWWVYLALVGGIILILGSLWYLWSTSSSTLEIEKVKMI